LLLIAALIWFLMRRRRRNNEVAFDEKTVRLRGSHLHIFRHGADVSVRSGSPTLGTRPARPPRPLRARRRCRRTSCEPATRRSVPIRRRYSTTLAGCGRIRVRSLRARADADARREELHGQRRWSGPVPRVWTNGWRVRSDCCWCRCVGSGRCLRGCCRREGL
jgi:hypothetical protein